MIPANQHVCLGAIAGPHGVQGAVRIKSFTAEPKDVGAYGPLSDETGKRCFDVTVTGLKDGVVLARLSGVADRDQAAALKGTRLYVARDRLPTAEDDEFYHADLIGIEATLPDGAPFGEIVAVWDFGAGDSLEITRAGRSIMVPFTRATVPLVDLARRLVVVDPPPGLIELAPDDSRGEPS